jgi:DNA-binding response OmpR family regulator
MGLYYASRQPFRFLPITTTQTNLNALQLTYMSQKKILIIEDSTELADSLEDMLVFKGYQALKAANGKYGLHLAIQEKPDLILLDLKLPDIDGYEVITRLREYDWGKNARVLILTATDTNDTHPANANISPDDVLHKSQWGIENLATRIEKELA